MKKFALAALIAVVAASPAVAAKKSKKAPAPVASANSNENSARLVRDSLPVFLPSWMIPFYLASNKS
ncbi:MAG: hypothetical protein NTV56_14465 [Alphaproteobacteria bacterium]|nr:hypothetical protein [Alphaproteobacteria bacterium]